MEWYQIAKEIIETMYMLSGVGLIIGLFFAYKQLKLMREDYNTKNKRAAVEKSIEYLNLFATILLPLGSKLTDEIKNAKVQKYKGPKSEDFRFNQDCNPKSQYIVDYINATLKGGAGNLLNQLEYFSAAMMSGLADEELAFTPLAESYCETVEELYPTLCYIRRKEDSNLFSNTVGLYNIWNSRLEIHKLEKHKSKIDESISKIEPRSIQSIWVAK